MKFRRLFFLTSKHTVFAAVYGTLGVVLAALVGSIYLLNSRPALDIWHTTHLESEYKAGSVDSFAGYMQLEQQLFDEVEEKIYQVSDAEGSSQSRFAVNRYRRGSIADSNLWQVPWNRTQEWQNDQAQFGVLLLHGMSDSPYAMSHLAQEFTSRAHVMALRLPGHGTLPSGLVELSWQDLSGAVTLATKHMKEVLGDKPLYVIGFSTGAALALNHELSLIAQGQEGDYDKMIFLSPAIGLPAVAAGAKWQGRLGEFLGLEKLKWNSIQTEYDPFKYTSFAVNAGDVVYQLSELNTALLADFSAQKLDKIAPIITFSSISDATVSVTDTFEKLYRRLPNPEHQLVLFDINRSPFNMGLVTKDPLDELQPIVKPEDLFSLTLVHNQSSQEDKPLPVQVTEYQPHGLSSEKILDLYWPRNVFSLSHVALPIPIEDSLYGPEGVHFIKRIQIGAAASSGERGVMGISSEEYLRQKWNPFYPYMLERIEDFIQ